MHGTSVSEVRAYPLRPEGFQEPLFADAASKRAVMEHLLDAPWLSRASELQGDAGTTARRYKEPVRLLRKEDRVDLVRAPRGGRRAWRRRRVVRLLDRWREVGGWWGESGGVDRLLFRVLLAYGAVAEVARERGGDWFLVGAVD